MSDEQQTNPLTEVTRHIMSERLASQLKMALPEHISVEKFQRVVITAVNKNADLVSADLLSLLTASVECAQDGLLPDGREAALVIYNVNTARKGQPKNWVKKVQYMPMIKGICKKAHNSGELPFLDMHVVHENDEFDYELGLHPHLIHKPKLGARGELIGAYAVARTSQGSEYIEVMSKDEIEAIRLEASKSKSDDGKPYGPWKNYYGEMARKTVLRRLSKRLPLSSDLSRVIERIDAMHTFENQAGAIETDAPARPKLEDFEPKTEAVEMFTVIDEFGESVGEFSKFDFVDEAVKRIDELSELAGGIDRLEAFMQANDGFEVFEPRSEERGTIASAYNAAREQCMSTNAVPTTEESSEDKPEDK